MSDYRAFLVDIEGVLVRDKRYQPIPGAIAWLNGLTARGIGFRLVSNNTTHRPTELIEALRQLGFEVAESHLVGALGAGVDWLRSHDRNRLFWLGAGRLNEYWQELGFSLVSYGQCDAVVLGLNQDVSVADLDRALGHLQAGADLVCLHRNQFYLDDRGERRLGPGAWAAALEGAVTTGRVVTTGKPEPTLYHAALESLGVAPEEALFISDDPVADLVTARRLGLATAFVLSGKHADASILDRLDPADRPTIVCARAEDLGARSSGEGQRTD